MPLRFVRRRLRSSAQCARLVHGVHRGCTNRSTHGHVVSIGIIPQRVPHRLWTDLTSTMVESTTPSHQYVLLNSTNLLLQTQDHLLPTPSEDVLSKRRPSAPDETPTKRPRLTRPNGEAGDGDIESFVKSNSSRHTMFSLLQTSSRRPPSSPRIICMYPFFVAYMRCSSLSSVQSTFAPYPAVLCIITQI